MDPKDVLSEEESQALQEQDPGGDEGENSAPARDGEIRDLHADHWERIVSDRIPALESVNERMVSMMKETAREFFRHRVEVGTTRGRSQRWGSYCRRLAVPTSLNVIQIQPADMTGAICLDADFVFKLTDMFFGGTGTASRPDEQMGFTPMEIQLVRRFVERIARDIQEAWVPFQDMQIKVTSTETNPLFARVATGSEMFTVTGVEFRIGDVEMGFQFLLPTCLVESVRNVQESGQAAGSDNESQRWLNRLKEDVKEASVSLRAVLAETEISLRELTSAKPGDVIATEIPANVTIFAGDEPVLEGTFGVFKNHNAVRVNRAIDRNALGEKHG